MKTNGFLSEIDTEVPSKPDQPDKSNDSDVSDNVNKKVIKAKDSVNNDLDVATTTKFETSSTKASSKIPIYGLNKSKLKISIKTVKKSSLIPRPQRS